MVDARNTKVSDARILPLTECPTEGGSLVVYQRGSVEQFQPLRTYYLYDIPSQATRGGHAHKGLEQIIVALSGSFEVVLDDSIDNRNVILSQPTVGLYLPPGLWRELRGFSGGAICLVLASAVYNEDDYIRDQFEFARWKLLG